MSIYFVVVEWKTAVRWESKLEQDLTSTHLLERTNECLRDDSMRKDMAKSGRSEITK